MTRFDVSFGAWFDAIALIVLDETGKNFSDMDSVREEFDNGDDHATVAATIVEEYK